MEPNQMVEDPIACTDSVAEDGGKLILKNQPITKSMVQDYPEFGMKMLKHPDELQKAMLTVSRMMVTDNHPKGTMLTTQKDIKGRVVPGTETYVHPFIRANIEITDAALIEKIKKGKKGVSPGFLCTVDRSPGDFEGEKYDGIQTDIIFDTLAIVDEGRCPKKAGCVLKTKDTGDQKMNDNEAMMKQGGPGKSEMSYMMSMMAEMEKMMAKMPPEMKAMMEELQGKMAAVMKNAGDSNPNSSSSPAEDAAGMIKINTGDQKVEGNITIGDAKYGEPEIKQLIADSAASKAIADQLKVDLDASKAALSDSQAQLKVVMAKVQAIEDAVRAPLVETILGSYQLLTADDIKGWTTERMKETVTKIEDSVYGEVGLKRPAIADNEPITFGKPDGKGGWTK